MSGNLLAQDNRGYAPDGTPIQNAAYPGQAYDPNDPNYHHYVHDDIICPPGKCTPQAAFDGLLRYAAPGQKGVSYTGKEVEVTIGGESAGKITQVVDKASLSVTNFTEKGHIFDPGYVTRSVVVEKGFVMVRTVGEGTGPHPLFNEGIAGPAWTYQDLQIKQYVLTHGPGS